MRLPIISRFEPQVTQRQILRAAALARIICREQPHLKPGRESFRHLQVRGPIGDDPALHLDDFSEIPVIGEIDSSQFLQQRARLRATDDDWIVQSEEIESGYAEYCEQKLGLGTVNWLYLTNPPGSPRQLAHECWQDRRVRHELTRAARHGGLRYVHPHMSTLNAWELAAILHRTSRRPITVIGPPPALARWANDKIEFTRTVARLLGKPYVPQTEAAYNLATLSKKVLRLAASHSRLAIKFPYGTGGTGNFPMDAAQFRGLSLSRVRERLEQVMSGHRWPQSGRVLINVWESSVIASPSVQTWIPPRGDSGPIVEGLFEQFVNGGRGTFLGSAPLRLPGEIEQRIVDSSYLLATLFQHLGYVGRCSFDLIIVGQDYENCNMEFIECNARWGGTSIPMTLMNRIHVDPTDQIYSGRRIDVPGLDRITFLELIDELTDELYDPRTQTGSFVLISPARLRLQSTLEALAIGESTQRVVQLLEYELPGRLQEIVRRRTNSIRFDNGDDCPPQPGSMGINREV